MIINCSRRYIVLFLTILLGVGVNCFKLKELEVTSKTSTPDWEQLCRKGHQYFFSEDALDWNEAKAMCELLGGYLVRIEDIHENNCILKYALNNGYQNNYWWTSGKLSKDVFKSDNILHKVISKFYPDIGAVTKKIA